MRPILEGILFKQWVQPMRCAARINAIAHYEFISLRLHEMLVLNTGPTSELHQKDVYAVLKALRLLVMDSLRAHDLCYKC